MLLKLLLERGFVGEHEALLALIDIDDFDRQRLPDKHRQIFYILERQLRSRDKGIVAFELREHAALDDFADRDFVELLLIQVFDELFPFELTFDFFFLDRRTLPSPSFNVTISRLDFIARMERIRKRDVAFQRKILFFDQTVGFIADIDTDFVFRDLNDRPLYKLTSSDFHKSLFELGSKIVSRPLPPAPALPFPL